MKFERISLIVFNIFNWIYGPFHLHLDLLMLSKENLTIAWLIWWLFFFFIISKSAFIWWKIINFQVKLYIMMAIWMQRTNNSWFSQQFRLSCKTQINTRRHFVQSWFFYYLAKTKLLFYLGVPSCYHLE